MADTSSHEYLAEARRIIAVAIENAIKHFSSELAVEDKVADYWPLGEELNEQTAVVAIEAFVKVTGCDISCKLIGLFVGVGER